MRLKRKYLEDLTPPPTKTEIVTVRDDAAILSLQNEVASLRAQLAAAKPTAVVAAPVASRAPVAYVFTFERNQMGFITKVIATPAQG